MRPDNPQKTNLVRNINMPKLKAITDSYMNQVPMVHEHCERCLNTQRWHGNAVLMLLDAAFDSIGLNYFQSVVPKVEQFRQEFVETGRIRTFEDLLAARDEELKAVWKNQRSWQMATAAASHLAAIKKRERLNDRDALIFWARRASLENWRNDPIGKIKGVGINTYQYLRMMGGVDTAMPDKIVKRVIAEILSKADMPLPATDIEFVYLMDEIAAMTGYRAIELCWMTWLIQSEAGMSRMEKYQNLLPMI
jgi:thermostable 8-oxoguanine DNA glycosylase